MIITTRYEAIIAKGDDLEILMRIFFKRKISYGLWERDVVYYMVDPGDVAFIQMDWEDAQKPSYLVS